MGEGFAGLEAGSVTLKKELARIFAVRGAAESSAAKSVSLSVIGWRRGMGSGGEEVLRTGTLRLAERRRLGGSGRGRSVKAICKRPFLIMGQ